MITALFKGELEMVTNDLKVFDDGISAHKSKKRRLKRYRIDSRVFSILPI